MHAIHYEFSVLIILTDELKGVCIMHRRLTFQSNREPDRMANQRKNWHQEGFKNIENTSEEEDAVALSALLEEVHLCICVI